MGDIAVRGLEAAFVSRNVSRIPDKRKASWQLRAPADAEPGLPSQGSSAHRGGRRSPSVAWQQHGPADARLRMGRGGSAAHIRGRAGGAGPGTCGCEATGPPSLQSAFDSERSDGPCLGLGQETGPPRGLVASVCGTPSPGSGVAPGGSWKRARAGLGQWPGGPYSDAPAWVLPLLGRRWKRMVTLEPTKDPLVPRRGLPTS